MPVTDQDVRALTYLARRLRDDTHGAGPWDEAGAHAKIAEMLGQNLAITIERVTRHAADPEARTPGAVLRPFVPPAASEKTTAPPPERVDPQDRCSVCSLARGECARRWSTDHDFRPSHIRNRPANTAERVQSIKQEIACVEPPAPKVRAHKVDPNVEALRAAKAAVVPPSPPPPEPLLGPDDHSREPMPAATATTKEKS